MLKRALVIQEKHYDSDHFEIAITLTNLGTTYYALNNPQETKELLERALSIFENIKVLTILKLLQYWETLTPLMAL
ncbi:tetratricopeptide repeat protein [Wolbachia endosymbiont of Mansonella ozzardi]|nr:tetratricopeptide repeat protein [Wolbachia endosymbiont of Mansonella ozzardi]MCA4774749.1 tetratricopeptide repeat protein [Wolbachia endosymbiont of Mansonella ozzardi]